MKNYTKLKVTSNNPSAHADFIGEWNIDAVEEEIREVMGEEPKTGDWIRWVIDHDIDFEEEFDKTVYNAILNDNVQSISFFLFGAKLTVTKS